jgi:hypothetical protein
MTAGLSLLYFASIVNLSSFVGAALFIIFYLILLLKSETQAFLFSFFLCIDVTGTFNGYIIGGSLITIIGMFFVLTKTSGVYFHLSRDIKFRRVLIISAIFSCYFLFVSIIMKTGKISVSEIMVIYIKYILGFLVIIPAYILTIRNRKEMITSIVVIAILFLIVYFINIVMGGSLFVLEESIRSSISDLTRVGSADLRQTFIFFTFFLPVTLVLSNKSRFKILIIQIIGVLSFAILVIGFLRLALFYVVLGTILTAQFISYYSKFTRVIKIIFAFIVIISAFFIAFPKISNEYFLITEWSFGAMRGQENDSSYDIRFLIEAPFLIKEFIKNIWTGSGIEELLIQQKKIGYFAMQDVPILGTLAAYGILGMVLYYLKFYFLLINSGIKKIKITQNNEVDIYIYLTIKAYLITMISFRLFYISWELTYDYQQVELGLFCGIYLALRNIIEPKPQNPNNFNNFRYSQT